MSDYSSDPLFSYNRNFDKFTAKKKNYGIHIILFVITLFTTTIAGVGWIKGFGRIFDIRELSMGLPYSLSILFVLGTHEFGHYFASKYHKVDATLPYFIPFPSVAGFLNFGTFGAIIKTKSPITSRKAMFDIGVAGPISGFIASAIILIYGFTHLPGKEYILNIHPDYFTPAFGQNGIDLEFGNTLLFALLKSTLTKGASFIPPMSEIYHYPYLCVGWFGLFVTSMNLIPVGQLDGGHIAYSVLGSANHLKIASISMICLIVLGILGLIQVIMNINLKIGWTGWLFWAMILFFFIKVKHPEINDNSELDVKRKIIGFIALIIFILSFSPTPFIISL
jgi:membrane-associated protease RseP (regulator of RpoE activity)